jgi:hydroxymethylglutaryl-CoA lyase
MADLPRFVHINEEGPREGFQIESADIPTHRKVELVDALSETGVQHIQVTSFVNPKKVPGMADADEVARRFTRKPGVSYSALWLNSQGLDRAVASGKFDLRGRISLCASDKFQQRNQGRSFAENLASQDGMIARYRAHGIPVEGAGIMAAFGCNFEGDIPPARLVELVGMIMEIAERNEVNVKRVSLSDTMAWATPYLIKQAVGAIRNRYPDLKIALHLHDTRGMGIANAFAGLEMGVDTFDAAVAGLGGCPFAGHQGAAGNVCTEDLVFMLEEMGIETGIDLERLIEAARLAEDIVGHPLPGAVMRGGALSVMRARLH